MNEIDLAYLAGLIDGEGHFGLLIHRRADGRRAAKFQFVINLRCDDRTVLEWVHGQLGIGKLYDRPGHGRQRPIVRYVVTNKEDCARLVALLDGLPLRSRKAEQFELWRGALLTAKLLRTGSPASQNDSTFVLLDSYVERIKGARRFSLST